MRKIVLLLLLAMLADVAYSQNGKIQGRVYNANNNEPLPFTNIVIWETNIGSTSDLDGNF